MNGNTGIFALLVMAASHETGQETRDACCEGDSSLTVSALSTSMPPSFTVTGPINNLDRTEQILTATDGITIKIRILNAHTTLVSAPSREKGRDAYQACIDDHSLIVSTVSGGSSPSFTVVGEATHLEKVKSSLGEFEGVIVRDRASAVIPLRGTPVSNRPQQRLAATSSIEPASATA